MGPNANQKLRRALEPLTEKCVAALADLIGQSRPPDTRLIDIEISPSKLTVSFWPTWFHMDASPGQIGDPHYLMLSDGPLVSDDEMEDGSIKILADWFGECWHRAGGATFSLPAYVCQHDDIESFDLRRRVWVDDEEKWPS